MSRDTSVCVTLLLLASASFAQPAEKSPFEQALEHETQVETKEKWVQYGGTRYREVEYRGQRYYMHFVSRDGDFAEIDCDPPSGPSNPHLAEVGVTVFRRSKAFVQLLSESCETKNGQRRTKVQLDPRIGFTIPDAPKDKLKNKKITIGPTLVPTFSGEW